MTYLNAGKEYLKKNANYWEMHSSMYAYSTKICLFVFDTQHLTILNLRLYL